MLNSLYKNALCFVCPSKYEGFGLPIFEAFAQSTPVIALKIPVFEELGGGGINFIDSGDSTNTGDSTDSINSTETNLFEKIKFIYKNEGKTVSTRVDFGISQVAKFTEEIQAHKWNEYFKNIGKTILEPKPFINIILQSYKETNPERLKELEYCIIKNLENPYVNSIHDFGNIIYNIASDGESDDSNKNIIENKFYNNKYVKINNQNNKWMTYDMAFQYANDVSSMYFGNYWCIINLDIFWTQILNGI